MARKPVPVASAVACLLALSPSIALSQTPTPPQQKPSSPTKTPQQQQPTVPPAPAAAVPSPVSRHYPILIVAHGTQPEWSLRLGMKGPERLDRPEYPPIILDPADITADQEDQSGEAWIYKAKDDATGAAIAVRLSREACSDPSSPDTRYTFRVVVQHAQLGALNGCGQSAPDKFPEFRKKNQIDMPDDIDPKDKDKDKDKEKDKKFAVLEPITKFQSPVYVAYLDSSGHAIVVHGAVHKTASTSGSDLALSHDGKKLLFTSGFSQTNPERSLLLYDYDTNRSREIAGSNIRQPFWSPDDSRIAYLKSDGQGWQVWTAPASSPETAALFSSTHVDSLYGWASPTGVLASDLQNVYSISEDRPPEPVSTKEIYGPDFQVLSTDTIRVCPLNPDLLLVSAYYAKTPAGAPTDSNGLNATFFLFEVHSRRRTILGPADAYSRNAEWSRDALQIFFTKGVPGKSILGTDRIFWDSTGDKHFSAGSYLVIGK
jgi:uncharacterized membrane protein